MRTYSARRFSAPPDSKGGTDGRRTFSEQEAARHMRVSDSTRREHDALIEAINVLNRAIASAAPGREPSWAQRVSRDLQAVRSALQAHTESSEGDGGLFQELDLAWPTRVQQVKELRQEHRRMLEQSAELVGAADRIVSGDSAAYSELRRQVIGLLADLRRHQAEETDLIFECFYRDIGVGD